jgi:hypothetical protein
MAKKYQLYWAYGSNLCVEAMKRRCPAAKKVRGNLVVQDAALVFRGVADVVYREGYAVQGGLWRITRECEEALDTYEGVAAKLYMKKYLKLKVNGRVEYALFYQMSISRGVMPPSEAYLATIAQGYKDFGLDLEHLELAVQESWDDKKVTQRLRRRHLMRGAPRLARPEMLEAAE